MNKSSTHRWAQTGCLMLGITVLTGCDSETMDDGATSSSDEATEVLQPEEELIDPPRLAENEIVRDEPATAPAQEAPSPRQAAQTPCGTLGVDAAFDCAWRKVSTTTTSSGKKLLKAQCTDNRSAYSGGCYSTSNSARLNRSSVYMDADSNTLPSNGECQRDVHPNMGWACEYESPSGATLEAMVLCCTG